MSELNEAFDQINKKIAEYDQIIFDATRNKKELLNQIKNLQKPFESKRKYEKSVREIILELLEKKPQIKASEIRAYLESIGRHTNPGVELGRMVKDKSILPVERGIYSKLI